MARVFKTNSGMAFINVIVATAIIGILVAALTTAIVQGMKENKYLEQKLAVMDLQRTMSSVAPGVNLCALSISKNPNTFPVASMATASISLSAISLDAAGTHILASINPDPTITGALRVASIQISQITDLGGTLVGNMVVSFSSERPLKPLTYKMNLQTTVAGTNHTLVGCSAVREGNGTPSPAPIVAAAGGQVECEASGGTWVNPTSGGRPQFCSRSNDILEWY